MNNNGTGSGDKDLQLAEVLDGYLAAVRAGTAPEPDALLAQHPELASDLKECLGSLHFLRQAGEGVANGPVTEEATPRQLGDFRIFRELGSGAMGVVYEAEQVSLRRKVALKVLPLAATLDPRRLQRFHTEARAAACLHHTNIVPVFAVGEQQGVHYYAMQLITGQTLAAVLRELRSQARGQGTSQPALAGAPGNATTAHAPLPGPGPSESTGPQAALSTEGGVANRDYLHGVARLGVQAAEALDYAHQLGVVHRDVKPGNLMVDGRGQIWITDFGLALLQQGDAGLTLTGDLVGTLRYMSPEQALAKRVVIDHRTDVYSLGATLYELLTLLPVFPGSDRQELLRQIAFEEPIAPRKLNRAIPAELETIVLKALEKNPAERYATAQALADDLRRFLEDKPIQARRPSLVQRARKWSRRHRAAVWAAAGVLLVALLASLAVTSWSLVLAEEATQAEAGRAAAEKRANAEAQKHLQQIEKGFDILASVFHDLDPDSEDKEGVSLRVLLGRRLGKAADLLEGEAVGNPVMVARLQLKLGKSLVELGHYAQAEEVLIKAQRTLETTLGVGHPEALATKRQRALVYIGLGKGPYEQLLKEVREGQTVALGHDHSDTLTTTNDLARQYFGELRYSQAETLCREVLEVSSPKLGTYSPITLASKKTLAGIYHRQGKYPLAEKLNQELLEANTVRLGPDHVQTLSAKNNLAVVYSAQGRYREAEALYREALVGLVDKVGGDHRLAITTKYNLAWVSTFQGNYANAVTLFQQVLKAQKWDAEHGGPTRRSLGHAYRKMGNYPQAETLLKEYLESHKAFKGLNDNEDSLDGKNGLAQLYQAQGKYSQAETLYQEVLAGSVAKLATNHPITLNNKSNLASLYHVQGKHVQAQTLCHESLEASTAKLGPHHPLTLSIKHNLADLYRAQGNYQDAETLFKDVLEVRTTKLGANHPSTLFTKASVARLSHDAAKYPEAEMLYKEVLAGQTARLGADHPNTLTTRSNLARLYWQMNKVDYSLSVIEEVIDQCKKKLGSEHPLTLAGMAHVGRCLHGQKKHAEAENVLRNCFAIRAKNQPEQWETFATQSLLGAVLLGQKKYATAAPLLNDGYAGLKDRANKIPWPERKIHLIEALAPLVALYEATGNQEQAARCRKELDETKAPGKEPPGKQFPR
jgi:serine/threonine protein kinase/Flp pilus assembly protein TadD